VPPIKQSPQQKADVESDPFIQTMQIPKASSDIEAFSQTIPQLRN
jgi:hypothetical protein